MKLKQVEKQQIICYSTKRGSFVRVHKRPYNKNNINNNNNSIPGNMMADVQLAPLRPIGDFLMESARFQIPNMAEADKWTKRVLHNLLYYQTNYFITALFVFLIIGIIHPVKMVFGFVAIAAAFGGFVFCTNNQWKARKFKKDHPIISVLIVLGAGYLLVYMLGAVIVFLLGIAFPLMLILLHASLRMRSIKNKFTNKMEYIGLKRTPMGIILEGFGQDQDGT